MKKNYRMLIGCQFVVDERVYTVCEVSRDEHRTVVEAIAAKRRLGQRERVRFPVDKVVECLLVEEEIELYPPNFLGVSGTA